MRREIKASGIFLLAFFSSLALVIYLFDYWLRGMLEEVMGR
jgi:hypothetical protein